MAKSNLDSLGNFIGKYFGVIIVVVLLLSLMFTYVIFTVEANTSSEAFNSDTEIHQAYVRWEDNFRPSMHGLPIVLEAKSGNILTMDTFRDIIDALDKVQTDDIVNPLIIEYFDTDFLVNTSSLSGLPTSIRMAMGSESPYGYQIGYHQPPNFGNTFSNANDNDLNFVLDKLFDIQDKSGNLIYREFVSSKLKEDSGAWKAPVLMIFIAVDNELFEENYTYTVGGEKGKTFFEEFDLHVMQILKDNIETCDIYGVGIGVEDEINSEIEESVPFMMLTFIIILIILVITFKNNLKSFAAAAIGLPLIIIWMMGTALLLNLSSTQFTAFLPILIMALGIDYAIHSMKRYEEELYEGKTPRESVNVSISKLSGTLALAMVTTIIAFFSNFFSTIPALKDWGLEAGIAIIWTFVIMGLFVPALRLGFERAKNRDVPLFLNPETSPKPEQAQKESMAGTTARKKSPKNRVGMGLSKLTFSSIAHPGVIIGVIMLLVIPLGYGALKIDSEFELEEFFKPDSDFVVGLDIYTEHFPTGGEPNILLIEGDIAEPSVVKAIETSRERFEDRGYATYYSWDISQIIENFTENLAINNMVAGTSIEITDSDNDGVPDNKAQIHAILKHATTMGLFGFVNNNVTLYIRPDNLQELVHLDESSDSFDKTIMVIGVAGSGSLNSIKEGMDNIYDDAQVLEATGFVEIVVTGTGPERWEQLTAISNSMVYSIAISIILCLAFLLIVFRRIGFALIAILPVVLIAIWLYGIMYFTGYHLNIVTATIGAMSIGVGVDYSIHVCDRYRKEKAAGKNFESAMNSTISNSGTALLFAALTTSFGFFVMLFAPMPMFFSFGLFSGLMVVFAFIGSVLVVPPLLKLIEKRKEST
jgi:predicted RND superfamily exporter protein